MKPDHEKKTLDLVVAQMIFVFSCHVSSVSNSVPRYLFFFQHIYTASPGDIGTTEEYEVASCTKSGHGTRVIPDGTFDGVHFVETPDYVQITAVGDFTHVNVLKGDDGGELDYRGATGKGNPSMSLYSST